MKDAAVAIAHPPTKPSAADVTERSLREAVHRGAAAPAPPQLRRAIEYAVFPGGARLRPHLCLAVARACGGSDTPRAAASAAAVELVHCASLVHDDLPCFDDAAVRRNRPTVHAVFGVPVAVLVGDALIVLAFETLARAQALAESVLLAAATGPSRGLIAGQAWESESALDLDEYHRAKTAALFEAAAASGALAAGEDPAPWSSFGELIGRAYQAADDVADVTKSSAALGKTSGRDEARGRPNLVRRRGLDEARRRVARLVEEARAAVPKARRVSEVHEWIDAIAGRIRRL